MSVWGPVHSVLGQRREMNSCCRGWLLHWAGQLATDAQLKAEVWVRKLEEELKLEKDMGVSSALLASGLEDKLREQDDKLESSACCFARIGGHKLPQIKVQEFVTKPD